MKLLIIAQKVDLNDDKLGFFHKWILEISKRVDNVWVLASEVGTVNLHKNTKVFSLGNDKGYPSIIQYIIFLVHVIRLFLYTDSIFIYRSPKYISTISTINLIFQKPIGFWYEEPISKNILRHAVRSVRAIISPTKVEFDYKTSKVVVTGFGVDTNYFVPTSDPTSHNKTHIVSISDISYENDTMTLIETANILVNQKKVTDFVINIAGDMYSKDKQYMSNLKSKITEYSLENYVNWIGPVLSKDKVKLLQDSDIYVSLKKEGIKMNELEAMACAVPTITSTSEYKEWFSDLAYYLSFENGNAKDLAGKIVDVMHWDRSTLRLYRRHALENVLREHSLTKVVDAIVNSLS